jgi:hypothetical protein
MSRDSKFACAVLGIIGFVITCWVLFYGTVAAIVIHFVHKYW